MKGSRFFSTLFAVVLILALTFSTGSAGSPPEAEDVVAPDGAISVDANPQPMEPRGYDLVYSKSPVFYFTRDFSAIGYKIEVYNTRTSTVVYEATSPVTCSDYICSMQPTTKLKFDDYLEEGGYYKWRVRSRILVAGLPIWKDYSDYQFFVVKSKGFTANFDTYPAFKNWQAFVTSWDWLESKGQISTEGTLGYRTTLMHIHDFVDFEFTVRMKRKVDVTSANFIYIYGYPTPLDKGRFDDGLCFQYTNSGQYHVSNTINGATEILKDWTASPAIKPFGWNELRVVANAPYVDLWINGTYLGWVEMPADGGNYVAVGMYSVGAGQPLLVDYAKVTAYYVSVQQEHDPAMQLGLNPRPATEAEINGE